MADFTIIVNDDAKGSEFPGNYDYVQSISAIPVFYDKNRTMIDATSVDMGSVQFDG